MTTDNEKAEQRSSNLAQTISHIAQQVDWLVGEAKAGRLGGAAKFQKAHDEWASISPTYTGPWANYAGNKQEGFSIVCPKDLFHEPHGDFEKDGEKWLVVPYRTRQQKMSYIAISADEGADVNWIISQFGDNQGQEIAFFERFLRLKTAVVPAPMTQEEKDIAELEKDFESHEPEEWAQ